MDRSSRFPSSTPAQTNQQPQISQSMGPIHPAHSPSHPLHQPFIPSQPVQPPPVSVIQHNAPNPWAPQRPAKRYREGDMEEGSGGRDWVARDRIAEQYAAVLPTVGDGRGDGRDRAADPQIGPGSWHQLPPVQHFYTTSPDRSESQSLPIPALPYSPAPPSDPLYSHYDVYPSSYPPSSSYSTDYPLAAAQGNAAPRSFDRALVCYRSPFNAHAHHHSAIHSRSFPRSYAGASP
jgi:hypothetical protein